MCGGVNDSDGKNISNDKANFSLLLILLPLLFFDLCFGRTWAIFFFSFLRWVVDTPNSTVGHLSIFSAQVGIFVPLILLRTLVHFYLSSHSFSFFSEVPGTCPFLLARIFLHNPCLFCIKSFQRERITTLGTVSDNFFSNFNDWWWMVQQMCASEYLNLTT